MHQSSTPSTPTNTGAARIAIVTYRSWIRWPCTVAPWPAQPVSHVPARAASPTRETLEAAIRIGWSGDRELEGHADGGVHRPLTTADLALLEAGQGVGARRQREHPGVSRAGVHVGDLAEAQEVLLGLVALLLGVGHDVVGGLARGQPEQNELVGYRARLAVGQGDDRLPGLDARRHAAVLELLHRQLVHGQPGRVRLLPLRLPLAAAGQRQRHHRDPQHTEPPETWPPPVAPRLPAHNDLLTAAPQPVHRMATLGAVSGVEKERDSTVMACDGRGATEQGRRQPP